MIKSIKKNIKKNICIQRQTSRISIWISVMVTNRSRLNKSSLFIHTAMHDGNHELGLIGGTQNALQHALYLSPLLRFTDWFLMTMY